MQAMKFRQNQLTSVMILPLIVYHTVQLVIGGMFATSLRRWAMEGTDSEVASSPRRRQSGILPSRSPAQSRKDIQYNSDFGSGGGGKDENGFLKPANHSGVLHSRSVNQSKEEFDDSVYLGGGSNDVSAKRD